MFRGVVFDFDGVIVDSHPVHKRAWKRLLESVGMTASEEELQFVMDGRKRDDILRHFLGELDCNQLFKYGVRKERYFREEAASVQTVGGFLNLLESLEDAHLALGVASSGSRSRIDFLLRQLNLTKRFSVVVTGDEVQRGKPDPAVFLKAAQNLGMYPFELMAFEDASSGVIAAKAAGMTCIGIATAERAPALLRAGAHYVVPDFQSLSCSKLRELFSDSTELKPASFSL
ncbi:MAG TPA: HAD family phosphatase [Candidatus Angelobacter sp.]|nr:HAD family phosphatase [Candidatus Angelobacter sp.]